ncbi:MAG: hypothetical protein LBM97_00220 [Candidatus Nomurabacteria bacterium]|jgi:hypothetical protein|nr:hypothetical protein [Candidatus Nomurabacteria bacterium]
MDNKNNQLSGSGSDEVNEQNEQDLEQLLETANETAMPPISPTETLTTPSEPAQPFQPTAPVSQFQSTPTPKPLNKKFHIALIIILFLIAIGLVAAIFLTNKKSTDNENQAEDNTQVETPDTTEPEDETNCKPDVETNCAPTAETVSAVIANLRTKLAIYGNLDAVESVVVKAPNLEYYVQQTTGVEGYSYPGTNLDMDLRDSLTSSAVSFFAENDFKAITETDGAIVIYQKDTITCNVSSSYEFSFSCAEFDATNPAISDAAPFCSGENIAHCTGNIIYAGNYTIKDSPIAPYQNTYIDAASLGIGGAAMEFYRVSPTSDWIFFRFAQGITDCEEYNSDELTRAFAGFPCTDGSGETVTVIPNEA